MAPAVGAVADGVEVFVVRPVERFVGHVRDDGGTTTDAAAADAIAHPPEAPAPPSTTG